MKLALGISIHNKLAAEEDVAMLKESYHERCDCCGIPTKGVNVNPLWIEDFGWKNACDLCFLTANLDQIPSIDKGVFIFCPKLTQQEVNVLCRLSWAVSFHLEKSKVEIEVREAADTLSIIMSRLTKGASDARSYFTPAINDVDSNVAYMNLMKDEEYAQRGLIYEHLRWMPDEEVFRESTRWYATEVFNQISIHHLQSQVDMFMNRISKG